VALLPPPCTFGGAGAQKNKLVQKLQAAFVIVQFSFNCF
jgi:hypothetical protein